MIEASGTAAGGQGTAAAKVQASLAKNGQSTTVTVTTDLTVTGKPAQFGRGLIADVSKKIIGQFAECLSKSLVRRLRAGRKARRRVHRELTALSAPNSTAAFSRSELRN